MFGKAGRADTATDPAPLEMFETTIQFKPRDQWRPGMTPDKLVEELDRAVKVPGLSNIWVPPIRNRIDMLATGIKSPVGIKVAGADLATIDRLAGQIEAAVKNVPGVSSALAERLTGGRYIDVDVDRLAAARYGLVGGRRAGRRLDGHRRRQRRRGRPGARALPHQRALSARDPRLAREAAAAAVRHPKRCHGAAAGRGAGDDRRTGRRCCAARTPACPAGSMSMSAAATCGRWCTTCRPQWPEQVAMPAGYAVSLVGAVRVPRARDRAAEGRRARDAGGHLRAALPAVPLASGTRRW